jgi:hypothetical protein
VCGWGVDKWHRLCYIGGIEQGVRSMKMELWTQCKDCKEFWDRFKSKDCPSQRCIHRRELVARAAEAGRWRQCKACRKYYQSKIELDICPACQAKHDANAARDREQLEAMKGQSHIGG